MLSVQDYGILKTISGHIMTEVQKSNGETEGVAKTKAMSTKSLALKLPNTEQEDDELDIQSQESKKLLKSLPRETRWRGMYLYLYRDFWIADYLLTRVISFQQNFQAKDTDIILATFPKSGTTWLKTLVYTIVNRKIFFLNNTPINTTNVHDLVPFFEFNVYLNGQNPDLSDIPPPRVFATHVPYPTLPESIKSTTCRIVYLCRNPFDSFISFWHFYLRSIPKDLEPLSLEGYFDLFCNGASPYGPFWDHFLGFWKESLTNPNKVLFLTYEDMKMDYKVQMKRLAEFLGYPFSENEEKEGVIEEVSKFCSFESMRELQPNNSGDKILERFDAASFLRKGEVGDWMNYLTPSMANRLKKVVEEKLGGSGLNLKLFG
ncbi:Sulfotransferase domain [Dillenia turbinata]|uniref:Sulfotransferase n=1 Tax=Dillenia turbinata TaxID=194707 RepID=A0AAN8W3P4_9MAGN